MATDLLTVSARAGGSRGRGRQERPAGRRGSHAQCQCPLGGRLRGRRGCGGLAGRREVTLGTLPAARCSRVSPAALRSPPCPWGQSLRSLNLRLDALALHVRWHGTRGTGPVSSPVTGQLLPTRKRPCWSLGAVTASGKVVLTSVSGKLAWLRAPRLWSVWGSMDRGTTT